MKRGLILSLLALLLALAGCGGVSREEYDRVCAERDALQARLEEARPDGADALPVTVRGTFAARVRDLIPDYVLDSDTPRVAVVTLFQSGPFTLQVGDLAQELEIGGTYVFEIEPREDLEITAEEYEGGAPFADEAISRYGLRIAGFRAAREDEFGLDSSRIVFEKRD